MTREELLRELRALPSAELDGLLQELLNRDGSKAPDDEVDRTVREVIERYRPALERLAQR